MKSFEELQKEYAGDGEKSCLTLTIPVVEQMKQYQIGMLEKNRLDLLLPLVVQRVNDEWKLSYDITSKIPLSRVLERKSLQHQEFEFIIKQFAALVHDLKEYLLDLSSVVLDKNYIYCDPAEFTLFFAYLPASTSEKEPERIKSFLRKLIVEDIRLVEDVSGALLKKLLEVLKSEAFSSELLSQCLNSAGKNLRQDSQQAFEGNAAAAYAVVDAARHKDFMPGVQADVPARADKTSAGSKFDGARSANGQLDYPPPRSNRANHPPSPPGSTKNVLLSGQLDKGNIQSTGISLLLQKYPKPSWFIAGGVNLLLVGVLAAIIASSVKNPSNTVSNIAGFLLIAAAGNYFLITRLFSKEKIITTQNKPDEPAGNTSHIKRFANENIDEDIILPKNPALRFREETNREKAEPQSVFQVFEPVQMQGADRLEAVQGMSGNNSLNIKASTVQQDNMPPASENVIEPVRQQIHSGKGQSALQTPDEKRENNQGFPDKTMILGRPSQQVPCLVSLARPYEKILLEKTSLLIGRLADNVDFVIQNRAIGKIHAEIKKVGERYFIIDLNSVNGTYVNGERLICNTETPLTSGDKITLANESYTFTA